MSGLPHHLNIDTSPGTPPQEWARSTTTAAFARSEPAPALDSDSPHAPANVQPTTAGVSIASAEHAQKGSFDPHMASGSVPGAYPPTPGDAAPEHQASLKAATEHASSLVQSAATTAAQYLPKGVVDTVSSYIPTTTATATTPAVRASEHDTMHTTSFPSSELSGAGPHEHVGGVGALPGPLNEIAVPELPEERATDERFMAAPQPQLSAHKPKETAVGPYTYTHSHTHTHEHSTAVTASTLPMHEPFGALPGDHSMGVGALPGDQSEANVALLPEESAHPQYDSGDIDNRAQVMLLPSEEPHGNEVATGAMHHVGGVGALVGDLSEVSVAKLPDEREAERAAREKQGAGVMPAASQPETKAAEAPALTPAKEEEHKKVMATGGHKGKPNQPGEAACGKQTDLLRANLTPRAHALGGDRAHWGAVPLHGARAREERDNDPDDGDAREGPGYDTDYHPAQLHPRGEEHPAGAEGAGTEEAVEEEEGGAPAPGAQHKARKASFMERMRGEAKVLLGKIEGKQEMVEEGQRLKAGEGKAAPEKKASPTRTSVSPTATAA